MPRWTRQFLSAIALTFGVLCSSTLQAAQGGEDVTLRKTYSGNIDYLALGASFRDQPNGIDACSFVSPMTSTINVNMPVGANVLDAYLYFAGSANGANNLSTQSGLTLNGVAINTTAGFNEFDYQELQNVLINGINFFGARRDVSNIVTSSGAYTFSGLSVNQGATNQTCLGAWALVVIFEDPAITQIRVVNLFDGFQFYQNDTFDLEPRNFVVDSSAPAGKMTHISYEGDETLATAGENFLFSDSGNAPSDFTILTNTQNLTNNQYNGTVTGPGLFPSTTEYGLDVDTYAIDSLLTPGAFEAITRYNTGQDLVLLMSEVIQVDNKPLADIEVTVNDVGTFGTNTTNNAQYLISVVNNGDGIPGSTTADAEGFIHIYNDLPAGISIDSFSDITAPGWNCSATNLADDEIRCFYDLSTLSGGDLAAGAALPDIVVTVDVGTPASPVTNIVRVTNCASNPDSCTTFAGKHTNATQFDPMNFFEEFEVDIFSVTEKSDINNNVDAVVTPIVTGVPSDLSTSSKSVSLSSSPLAPGDTLTYTINLVESSGITNATGVTVIDVIDPDATGFSLTSNSCVGTPTFSLGVLTVSGFDLAAGTSCDIEFDVVVPLSATPGTLIDNSATISSTNGIGATVVAPSQLVSGTATGSKLLYFDALNGTEILSRAAPASSTFTTLGSGGSITLELSPVLAANLDINAGVIPVSVWIEGTVTSGNNYSVTADLSYPGSVAISSDTISGVAMTAVGGGNLLQDVAQLFPFQLNAPGNITDFATGETLTLTLTNNSLDDIRIHSLLNNIDSNLVLDAETVINVDDVAFFTDVARTDEIVTGSETIEAGTTIYIEATISDPFGFADITGATLTLIDPNLANQLTDVAMTEVPGASGAIKQFTFAYNIPDAASIDPGGWVAQVTGLEGDEGTVTHTEADSFETIAPNISVTYTVDNNDPNKTFTASPGDTLTYTITIDNGGAATNLDIDQGIPGLSQSLTNVTGLPPGATNTSTASNIALNFDAPNGQTVITFEVQVVGSATAGQLVDHTIALDNSGTPVSDIAPSVLIDPFNFNTGNKPIYGDAFNTVRRFDRTEPTSNTSTTISSQGASQSFTLSPVLQGTLNLAPGDINASIWVSRGTTSFAGQRIVEATLGFAGAANGTIGTDTITIQLEGGFSSAQYLPFTFNLAAPLALPANTSLTLTVRNNTTVAGETIMLHTFNDGDSPINVASLVSLNATDPLNITAIEYFTDSVDTVNPGTPITETMPSSTVFIRATVSDPFGRDDITGANITITDPTSTPTASNQAMLVPTAQPASNAEKYFEISHTLSAELGDWTSQVTAVEGVEVLVSDTDSAVINVNNNTPDLADSFKYVLNTTTGSNADNNPGDTLRYTIELVNSGLAAATNASITDNIPANTTFVPGSLVVGGVVQADPGNPINLTNLNVAAGGSLVVTFDVTINGGVAAGDFISNTATITNVGGVTPSLDVDAEDLVIDGAPATGTKLIYLEDMNTGTPILTRLQPQTGSLTDRAELQNGGGSVTLDLTPELARDITISGNIDFTLRFQALNRNNRNRAIQVDLGYTDGGPVTSIGSDSDDINLFTGDITSHQFGITLASPVTIPAGNRLRLTVINNQNQNNRDAFLYSFDTEGDAERSRIEFVPDPVINVDSITFWTDTMGAGTQVTNPNPTSDVDIFARIIISDPFGEGDIQSFDAATNPSTIAITDPDGAITDGGTDTNCVAPCFAFDGEDTTNDTDPGTRTFYYLIRINSDPPSTRGTWSVEVVANEGLEVGAVSHTRVTTFSTLEAANLSTSTKTHNVLGDVTNGSQFTYTVTLINSGALDADNVQFSDTLQGSPNPATLSFVSASTTCTDEAASPLPNPVLFGEDVILNNISVVAGGSCSIDITVSASGTTPGDLINNMANIVNPGGPGGTPAAPTILFEESQIPAAGNKQIYFDLSASAANSPTTGSLTRTQPSSSNSVTLDPDVSTDDIVLTLANVTERATILDAGSIAVNMLLSETGGGTTRDTEVELEIDSTGDGNFDTTFGPLELNLGLSGTPTIRTFNFTNTSALPLAVGASFRVTVRNNQRQNNNNHTNRVVILTQSASAPYSELVVPLIDPIEITQLRFFDLSATDDSLVPGCDATLSCGTEIDPGVITLGNTIWARAEIADVFGASDVNTGCDGVTASNCPSITVTDPVNPTGTTSDMVFVGEPNASTRIYEFAITPAGMGLEGTWQINLEANEGIEGVVSDTAVNTFELAGVPNLTIVKSVAGNFLPTGLVTYTNNVGNNGTAAGVQVEIVNDIGDFIALELTDSGGSWTAIFSLVGAYTVASESFEDSLGPYDPNIEGVCAGAGTPTCYDPAIKRWIIQLNEPFPVGDSLVQEYRVQVE